MEVTINGVKKEVSKEEMKDRVIGYYDAVGIKHFYLEVDEMDENELKESIKALAEPDKVLFSQDEIKELYDRHYNWNKNLARILDCIFD